MISKAFCSNLKFVFLLLVTLTSARMSVAQEVEASSVKPVWVGQLSLSGTLGQLESKDAGLSRRWMNAFGADGLIGYQRAQWLLGGHADFRSQGQNTRTTSSDGTNLKGQGYFLGVGARFQSLKSWYGMAAVDFWGQYDFLKPSTSGYDTYLHSPIGVRAKLGRFIGPDKRWSFDGDVQVFRFSKYRADSGNENWKASQWLAGVALTYHFGRPSAPSAPIETPVPAKPQETLSQEISQLVPTTQVGDALMIQMAGDTSFAVNSAEMTESAKQTFAPVAQALSKISDKKIRIEGHTDSTGSAAWNSKLSVLRAESVKKFFIQNGVAAENIQSQGYGSEKPVADNKTKEGRSKNRRVEIYIDGK